MTLDGEWLVLTTTFDEWLIITMKDILDHQSGRVRKEP